MGQSERVKTERERMKTKMTLFHIHIYFEFNLKANFYPVREKMLNIHISGKTLIIGIMLYIH